MGRLWSADLEKFQSLNHMKKYCGPISAKVQKKIMNKFKETDTCELKSGGSRKIIILTLEENVVRLLYDGSSSGEQTLRKIPQSLYV